MSGKTWRKITVEVSPDEGMAASKPELFAAPHLEGLGIPSPDYLVGLSMAYQIAQKVHASTDPHEPPTFINERARDVVDLLLLKEMVDKTGEPTHQAIHLAIVDVFAARASDARQLGRPERMWPARLSAYPHWRGDYDKAAVTAGIRISLDDAVETLNAWLGQY